MRVKTSFVMALAALVTLSACQSERKPVVPAPSGKSASLRAMELVAISAHKCWIASKDPAFRPYRMANELNSFTGNPRFLLVPAGNYGGLPALVVQARGTSSQVEIFGPLLNQSLGHRVQADVARWQSGDASCSARG